MNANHEGLDPKSPHHQRVPSSIPCIPSAVWVLMLLGLALRVYRIDSAEMWTDEMSYTLWSQMGLKAFLQNVSSAGTVHLPVYPVLLGVFIKLLGFGEFTARLSALIPGVLSIVVVYLVGSRFFTKETGVISAALMTFSPTAVYTSQEVAPYSLVVLCVALSAWLFSRACERNRIIDWVLFTLAAVLSWYTYIYTALALLVFFAVFVTEPLWRHSADSPFRLTRSTFLRATIAGVAIVIAASPVMPYVLRGMSPENAHQWDNPSPYTFLGTFALILRMFIGDRQESLPIFLGLVVLSLPFLLTRREGWLVCALVVLSVGLPLYLVHSRGYTFRARHYTYALPFAVLLASAGIDQLRRLLLSLFGGGGESCATRVWPSLAFAGFVLVVPFSTGLYQYYLIRGPQSLLCAYELNGDVDSRLLQHPLKQQLYSKSKVPEYREIASILRRNAGPGDILILDAPAKGDDIARNIAFQLNMRFGLRLPVDPKWAWPVANGYEPSKLCVMLSDAGDQYFDSIRRVPLALHGVRVFRASQRYPVAEVESTSSLKLSLISLACSSERFTEPESLITHLKAHCDLSRATDVAIDAEAALEKKQVAEAEMEFRKSLSIYRTSRASDGLGGLLLRQGKGEEALPLLVFAAKARGNRWDYWMRAGKAYEALGKGDEAIQSYETAAVLPNATPWVRLDLARLYELKKDFTKAHQQYESAASELDDPGYKAAAIRMLLKDAKAEEALREGLELVSKHPEHGSANLVVAMAYERLGDKQNAYGYLVRAADLRPDDISTQAACADYQIARGEFGLAEARLRSALEKHPGDATLEGLLEKVRRAAGKE